MPCWCRARAPRARSTGTTPIRALLVALLSLGFAILLPGSAFAHSDPAAPVPSLQAVAVDAPLVVDGVLDEPFWSTAPVGTGFIDNRTLQPSSERTTVRVAYTRTHLYIAVECFDDRMAEVHATEQREDRPFDGDDWVEVHLDPPHTHRSKYAFFTNPLGTRADANEGPSGVFNYGWSSTEWQSGARIETNRWTFEMRIPFSILNYERRDDRTWGFNLTRQTRSSDTLSFWSFSATDTYKPRHFGHLTDLDLADTPFDRRWEITPYVSARADFNGDVDTFVQGGLDVSTRLTPSITGALTINPDFGQIEADAETIELRDTERFLPEKRPFFREGDELMRMTHQMYYSRRFGDIDAGLNVSGQSHGISFSALNIQGDLARPDYANAYYGNSTVLRALQGLGERSSLGYYLANSELEGDYARAAGVDSYLFLTDALRLSLQGAATGESLRDPAGALAKDREDYLGYGALIFEKYPWSASLGYNAISEQFNPFLGYIPRRNVFGPTFSSQVYLKSKERFYREFRLSYDTQHYSNQAGNNTLRDHHLSSSVLMPGDITLRLGQAWEYHEPFQNNRTSAGMTVFTSDMWRSATISWAGGTFTNSNYNEFTLGKPFKPWERLPLRWEFTIRLQDNLQTGTTDTYWFNRVVFDLYLGRDMWIKSSLQHKSTDDHNISVIYGWQFRARTWWYLAFNSVRDPFNRDAEGESIFSKLTYTF